VERFLQSVPNSRQCLVEPIVKATAHPLPSQPAPASEQSSVRRSEATRLTSTPVLPVQRGSRVAEKLRLARAMQRRLPVEDRRGQLLAVAILRQDEALLDELIQCLTEHRR
jgi:hypothetical protein